MSTYCQVSGKHPRFGKSVSHSHKRTSRRFNPNLQKKKYWVPSLKRSITLTLTPKAMRTIDRRGIDAVVQEMLARGEKL